MSVLMRGQLANTETEQPRKRPNTSIKMIKIIESQVRIKDE